MRAAQAEGKDWSKELMIYLLVYRSTPHAVTGQSPAEMLCDRQLQTILPEMVPDVVDPQVRARDQNRKEKGKQYIDQRRGTVRGDVQVGDRVLLKGKRNKLSTNNEARSYTVIERRGNSVVCSMTYNPMTLIMLGFIGF